RNCKALDVLADASRVRANLSGQTLDHYLDTYLTAWAQPAPVPVADAAAQPNAPQPGASPPRKMVNIDFPTSASIPPVSIMSPEPKGAAGAAPAAAASPSASPPAAAAPAKKLPPRKQAAAPAAPTPAAPPPAAAPSASAETLSPDGQADPVWIPAPLAPPQA